MSQIPLSTDTASKEGERDEGIQQQQEPTILEAHLSKFNVPNKVYSLLLEESITIDELITFTNNDLETWSKNIK